MTWSIFSVVYLDYSSSTKSAETMNLRGMSTGAFYKLASVNFNIPILVNR